MSEHTHGRVNGMHCPKVMLRNQSIKERLGTVLQEYARLFGFNQLQKGRVWFEGMLSLMGLRSAGITPM